MKPSLLSAAGLLLAISLTGCCCNPYRNCCPLDNIFDPCCKKKKHDNCCQPMDPCLQQTCCDTCGGQQHVMAGQQYALGGDAGCPTCGPSGYQSYPMTIPSDQLQPTPTFETPGTETPTPAPPANDTSALQTIPQTIIEQPAPIPNSAAQNGVTRQLQWVPSRR